MSTQKPEDVSDKVRDKRAEWKDGEPKSNEGRGLSGDSVGEETLDREGPSGTGSSGVSER